VGDKDRPQAYEAPLLSCIPLLLGKALLEFGCELLSASCNISAIPLHVLK
jgi:hypothetical protein